MKKYILLLTLIIISQMAYSQQDLFLGFSGDYGIFHRSFEEKRDVLRTKSLGSMLAGNISLQYRIANRITFETGVGFHRQRWALKDHNFEQRHPGFIVDIVNRNPYNTFFFGIQYSQPINPKTFLYFQATGIYNLIGKTSLTESSLFVEDFELVEIVTNYPDNYYSVTPEIGLQWFTKKHRLMSIGLKYNYAFTDNLMNGTYTISNNGNIIQQDKFTASGSYVTFNFKYNFVLAHKPKKERPVKQKEIKEEKPEEQKPVVKDEKPVEKEVTPKTDHVVAGRDYYVTNKVRVKSNNVTIKVWDHSMEDGDIISLNLNGNWVIENYTITKAKKEFTVALKDGENHLVLHALNLGKYKPNTASISVHDGEKEQVVVLESNLEESGALEIFVKP